MNGDHKKREPIQYRFLTALAIAALFLGSGNAVANQTVSDSSHDVKEQMQSQSISGVIVDNKGELIIGASVLEKGTTNGTITNIDGRFMLSVKQGATLVISYVGYKTQETKATNNMRIVLQEDSELLDEVVVVGYGTQKKVNLTGAVSTVDVGKTVDSRPITDIGRALQGAVPGLTISTKSGELGSAPTIKIRGAMGSPNGDAKPLILVDNVEVEDISFINPDDIESISVLKDAASASIYGARGAFGVLLITTKAKQKHESVTVKYSNNFAWRTPTTKSEQLPGWQQADINLQGIKNSSPQNFYKVVGNIFVNDETVAGMKNWAEKYGSGKGLGSELVEGRDYIYDEAGNMHIYRTWDWYDMYIKDWMPQQTHNLSVNGGNGRTNYGITLGYLTQEGLTKDNPDTYDRYNANLTLNTEINKYISIRANAMYTRANTSKPFTFNTLGELYDPMYYLYRWQPMYPYATIDGKPIRNALVDLQNAPMNQRKKDYVRLGGGLTLKPIEGLTIDWDVIYTSIDNRYHTNGGKVYGYNIFDSTIKSTQQLINSYGVYTDSGLDYTREERSRRQMITNNIVATYSKKIGSHDFKVMAGSNIEESKFHEIWAQRKGMLSQQKPELNLATGDQTVGSERNSWAVAGFFGRINYAFMDRYLLELNGRYDGSSRFPKGDRFAFFPSVSVGYRISEENFMKPLYPVLSSLKLRGSYGTIGNQDVGLDRFVSTLSAQSATTAGSYWYINGIKQTAITTPTVVSQSLTWETVKTIDFGFDARFFDEKLGVTFDWYKRTTSDVLTTANLPQTLGATSPYQNSGELETPGWELAVDYRHDFNNGLSITLGAQLSDNKTKVKKWTENTAIPDYGGNGNGWYWETKSYKEGMVLGDIWGLKVERLLQESDFDANGNPLAHVPDQSAVFPGNYKLAPGDVLYKDVDGDGFIKKGASTDDPEDYAIIGNALPRYEYGFSIGAEYKGFDFNMFFQGVGKRDLWAMGNQVLPGFTAGEPYYKGAEDYWRPDNTNAYYPRPINYGQAATGNYTVNDRYLLDMAYLRCKTLTLGYTLPKVWVSKAYIKNLRVYFTAENLFEFTNVKPDIDPEIDVRYVGTRADSRNFGRSYPYQRTLSFGLQVTL